MSCPHGASCVLFQDMLEYKFTEEGLAHVTTLRHPMKGCRHWSECKAFRRLRDGGDRFDDRCHNALYIHCRGERGAWTSAAGLACEGFGERATSAGFRFCYPYWTEEVAMAQLREEADALDRRGLDLVRAELASHRLGHEMRMVTEIVPRLKSDRRLRDSIECTFWKRSDVHLMYQQVILFLKRRPATDVELLSLLLYTGTDAQGQLRRAMRASKSHGADVESWRWTITAIRHAAIKLADQPPPALFHGLNGVKLDSDSSVDDCGNRLGTYWNLISGSMNKDIAKDFAAGKGGTVSSPAKIGSVLEFESEPDSERHMVAYADLRWISKFAYEEEWLIAPISDMSCLWFVDDTERFEDWKGCTLQHQVVRYTGGG